MPELEMVGLGEPDGWIHGKRSMKTSQPVHGIYGILICQVPTFETTPKKVRPPSVCPEMGIVDVFDQRLDLGATHLGLDARYVEDDPRGFLYLEKDGFVKTLPLQRRLQNPGPCLRYLNI